MKKQLLLIVMFLLPMLTWAEKVEIDGIYYNLINATAEVTSHPTKYTGNVVIPESVTYDNVNYSVKSIEGNAFYNCKDLTSVTIPNSITIIREGAFSSCDNLTAVYITDIAAWCEITFLSNESNPLYYANHLYLNGVEIKDLTIPSSVKSIRNYTFYGFSGLNMVTIPNGVTSIGYQAFAGCASLTSVTIPSSVTIIRWCAFGGCTSLASITIPNSVTTIEESAFSCTGLISVTIPNSVTSIGELAFASCSNLTSITIANSVTSIGWGAFQNCSNLTSIIMSNSVMSIENQTFSGCSSLTSITIPNNVISIGKNAFSSCSSLTSVTIPNSVISIGERAFYQCYGLASITIPNSVTTIEERAFSSSGLTAVTIPNSVENIGKYAFSSCSSLTSATISNGVKSIENGAFSGCSGLTSITIPNSVTSIGDGVFYRCSSLTSVTIGNGIESIGAEAFASCRKNADIQGLRNIYCYAVNVPSTNLNAFNETYIEYVTLHVPAESVNAYKAAEPWKNFKEIVELQAAMADDNYLHLATIDIYPGETKEVQMLLTNANTVAAIQGKIKLPAGLSFVKKANGKVDANNIDSRSEDFTLSCAVQDDGSMTFAHYSADGFNYMGNNGGIFSFKIKADENAQLGSYYVNLTGVVLSIDGVGYDIPDRTSTLNITGSSGIAPIDNGELRIDHYYTLDGQKLVGTPTKKGVYIVNGRKVVVK